MGGAGRDAVAEDAALMPPAPLPHSPPAAPLESWAFAGELRQSQQRILDAVAGDGAGPLHIVAPPGSGKTLVGLLLAMRRGSRALVLAPTTTIRSQWAATARSLASGAWGDAAADPCAGAVSEEPGSPADLTVLTYQMLSVLETSNPFDTLAEHAWRDELVAGGRDESDAEVWLAELAESNRDAYHKGLRRRGRRLRRDVVRADPSQLAAALHPNARALIDRLVEHGVETVILDECHHLLDHWAIVVHYLAGRVRERGAEPLLVGLTATLPSLEDQEEYENYTGLLGEVDYELPTPAVVKEGNLAPYRDLVWFVSPSADELLFLKTHEDRLGSLISETLGAPVGLDFMERILCGGEPAEGLNRKGLEIALAEAFKRDAVLAEAACRVLLEEDPQHPLGPLLGAEARIRATTEQRIRLLARYALDCILPDAESADLWQRTRRTLADFGYLLTDRGIRRGRDPIDSVLATSESKDLAVGQILRLELARDAGERLRAVAILDFAVHGHSAGGRGAARRPTSDAGRAGALRCFDTVVADPSLALLRPVLMTAQHLRIAARDAEALVPRLAELLGNVGSAPIETEPLDDNPEIMVLSAPGVGSAAVVRAVSQLVTEGLSRLIVGTRGLLGEGWDCPAVNTLIDLSSVATSSATQQLRGRTLRLDPGWPEKVAHNWTVTTLIEATTKIDGDQDAVRLARKHGRVWGLTVDGLPAIVKGLDHTLTSAQSRDLGRLLAKDRGAPGIEALNRATAQAMTPRAETRARWGIGEPYRGSVGEELVVAASRRTIRPFVSGFTIEAILALILLLLGFAAVQALRAQTRSGVSDPLVFVVTFVFVIIILLVVMGRTGLRELRQGLRQFALPQTAYHGAVLAIARTLDARGELPEIGPHDIAVRGRALDARTISHYEVEMSGGTPEEQRIVLDTLGELFSPVASPRFLLETGSASFRWASPASWLAARIAVLLGQRSRFFAVPRPLGRRRADAQFFARQWRLLVGPCVLHEIDSPQQLALLTRARRWSADSKARPRRREVWS